MVISSSDGERKGLGLSQVPGCTCLKGLKKFLRFKFHSFFPMWLQTILYTLEVGGLAKYFVRSGARDTKSRLSVSSAHSFSTPVTTFRLQHLAGADLGKPMGTGGFFLNYFLLFLKDYDQHDLTKVTQEVSNNKSCSSDIPAPS